MKINCDSWKAQLEAVAGWIHIPQLVEGLVSIVYAHCESTQRDFNSRNEVEMVDR